jgi:hypothetical protein
MISFVELEQWKGRVCGANLVGVVDVHTEAEFLEHTALGCEHISFEIEKLDTKRVDARWRAGVAGI